MIILVHQKSTNRQWLEALAVLVQNLVLTGDVESKRKVTMDSIDPGSKPGCARKVAFDIGGLITQILVLLGTVATQEYRLSSRITVTQRR